MADSDLQPNAEWSEGNGPEEIFRTRLRQLREAKSWSQKQLAAEMSRRGHAWYQSTVTKVESGQRPITLSESVAIARVFAMGLEEMWTPAGQMGREEAELRHRAADLHVYVGHALTRMEDAKRDAESAQLAYERARSDYEEARAQLDEVHGRIKALRGDWPDVAKLPNMAELAMGSTLMTKSLPSPPTAT